MQFAAFGIDPHHGEFCRGFVTEIPQIRHHFQHLGVRREYRATLAGMKDFCRVETAGADVSILEDRPSLVGRSEAVCSVVYDLERVFFGNRTNGFDITGVSEYMCCQDAGGL